MEKETRFSEEGKEAIKEIVRHKLEDILKRISRLEHKVYHFKVIPSKGDKKCQASTKQESKK